MADWSASRLICNDHPPLLPSYSDMPTGQSVYWSEIGRVPALKHGSSNGQPTAKAPWQTTEKYSQVFLPGQCWTMGYAI